MGRLKWTIGMPAYDNITEVYFTVQSLRMYHNLKNCEIVVIDNYGDDNLLQFVKKNGGNLVKYYRFNEVQGVSHAKNAIFNVAKGENVLCIDSHILLKPGIFDIDLESDDFYQGPLLSNSCDKYYLQWLDLWRNNMWGVWDKAVDQLPYEKLQIWATGAGFFACKRDSWLGFNDSFRGFGGETGYIQEKYRKNGKAVWCDPRLIWQHYFGQNGRKPKYIYDLTQRIRNYLIGFNELGLDIDCIKKHFGHAQVDLVLAKLIYEGINIL